MDGRFIYMANLDILNDLASGSRASSWTSQWAVNSLTAGDTAGGGSDTVLNKNGFLGFRTQVVELHDGLHVGSFRGLTTSLTITCGYHANIYIANKSGDSEFRPPGC